MQPAGGVQITEDEKTKLLDYLSRLANFIANKDDPDLKTTSLWNLGGDKD